MPGFFSSNVIPQAIIPQPLHVSEAPKTNIAAQIPVPASQSSVNGQSPEEIARIKKTLLPILLTHVETDWFGNPNFHKLLYEELKKAKGIWQFNIASRFGDYSLCQTLSRFLKLRSKVERKAALELVREIIPFMLLYRTDECSDTSQTDYLNGKNAKDDSLILSLCPKKEGAPGNLSEIQTSEVAEIFLRSKLQEFKLRLNKGKLKTPADGNMRTIPCYIVSQDKHRAHLEVLCAQMDSNNSLRAIERSNEASTQALQACGIQIRTILWTV